MPAATAGSAWSHILCTYDPVKSNRTCYYNGAVAAVNKPVVPLQVTPGNFRIGSTHLGEHFIGLVDDVAIFNRTFTRGVQVVVRVC